MAYSFQTFSIGQILTAVQMNQVEASIRDHQHGVAGVSSSGMTFVAPALGAATGTSFTASTFTASTQISTPSIITASGALTITPANNVLNIGNPASSNTVNVGGGAGSCVLNLDGGGGTGVGSLLQLKAGGTLFGTIGNEAVISGSGSSKELCYFSNTGLGHKWMVNGSATVVMGLSSAGVLTIGPAASSVTTNIGQGAGTALLALNGGGGTGVGSLLQLKAGGTLFGEIANEAVISGSGSSKEFCYFSETGLGQKWMVNGSATAVMALSSAGVFSVGSASQFAVSAAGVVTAATVPSARLYDNAGTTALFNSSTVMTAGIVPLARMRRSEETLTGTATQTFGSLNVEVGDRILLTGSLSASTSVTSLKWDVSSSTAGYNFGGNPNNLMVTGSGTELVCSGVCSVVTTAGTLVLRLTPAGTGTLNTYGQIIVLRGVGA